MFRKIIIHGLVLISNIFFVFIGLAHAEVPLLSLQPEVGVYDVSPYIEYYIDQSRSMPFEQVQALAQSGGFQPSDGSMDFGDYNAAFWLHLRVKNPGAKAREWVLNTGSQRMQYAEVFFVKGDKVERQMLDSLKMPYTERPIKHRLLLANLTLGPQESVDLYFAYISAKSSYFPLKIMQPEAFAQWDAAQSQMEFLILGAILVLALYSVFLFFTAGNYSFIYYLIFIAATFMYLLHQFGFTYQYFWPNHPYFNSYAAGIFGFTAGISGLLFGRSFFEVWTISRYLNWLYLTLVAVFAVGTLYLYLWPNGVAIGVFGFMFGTVSALLNFITALIRYARKDMSAGIAALGWSALIVWGAVINLTSFGVLKIPQHLIFDNFYMIYAACSVAETFFLTLSLFVRTYQVIQANHRTRQDYIRMLEVEAETAKTLAIALQDRQSAIEDAARKGWLVESIAHDIRQPLLAMRLSNYGAQKADAIADEAISMIESILTTAFAVTQVDETDTKAVIEPVPLQSILLPLSLVFTPSARDANIGLRVMPSSLVVLTDRKILMRILNNLVTNAILYTKTGHVLVGCRRRANGIAVQVLDTGIGFTLSHTEAPLNSPAEKPNAPSGEHGLGLTICHRLCAQIGAEFTITSIKGRGTVAEVFMPA